MVGVELDGPIQYFALVITGHTNSTTDYTLGFGYTILENNSPHTCVGLSCRLSRAPFTILHQLKPCRQMSLRVNAGRYTAPHSMKPGTEGSTCDCRRVKETRDEVKTIIEYCSHAPGTGAELLKDPGTLRKSLTGRRIVRRGRLFRRRLSPESVKPQLNNESKIRSNHVYFYCAFICIFICMLIYVCNFF